MGFNINTVIVLFAFAWPIYKYIDARKREQDLKEFEHFHRLIKELVQPDSENGALYLDRQAAIVYELRHFKRYYSFSLRTLKALKVEWEKWPRLTEEIDLTIVFLESKIDKKKSLLKFF